MRYFCFKQMLISGFRSALDYLYQFLATIRRFMVKAEERENIML